MSRLAILCCIVAVVTGELGFRPKQQYEYNYEGKLLTGIPGVGPQWSGCAIRGKLIVQGITENILHVQLKDTQFASVESQRVDREWKDHFPLEFTSVPQHQEHLEKPIVVELQHGAVEKITVDSRVPEEIVNLQKSIVSMLQVNLQQNRAIQSVMDNTVAAQKSSSFHSFKVMEKGISGECETSYQLSRVPEFLALELNQTRKVGKLAPSTSPLFMLTKTKNYENCHEYPVFQHLAPAPQRSQPGWQDNNGTAANRSSVSNYYMSGDQTHFTIHHIETEGETIVYPLGHQTEQLFSASNQTLDLVSVQPIAKPIPVPTPHRELQSLTFTYPTTTKIPRNQQIPQPSLEQPPPMSTIFPGAPESELRRRLPFSVLKQKIHDLLSTALRLLHEPLVGQRQDLPMTIITLERALSMLSKSQLQEIYTQETAPKETQQKTESKKAILRDSMMAAGTNPNVMQLISLIEQNELSQEQASQVVMFLPMFVKTPTKELFEELFKFIKSHAVQQQQQLKITSYLSFTNLLRQSCVTPQTYLRSSPVHLFGQFCDPSWEKISQTYIPFFQQEAEKALEQQDTVAAAAYIQAIGNIGHKDIIDVLEPYISGRKTQSLLVRSKSIYTLQNLTRSHPQQVLPILASAFHNYNNSEKVRLAAVTMVLHSNPPLPYWEKIATSTWYEPCEQVVSFVHSAFATLANSTSSEQRHQQDMAHKARLALPMCRPAPRGLLYTHKLYATSMIKEYLVGSNGVVTWQGSYHSAVPSVIYGQLQNYYNGYVYSPAQVSLDTNGIQSIIDKFFGPEGVLRKLFSQSEQESKRSSPRDISLTSGEVKQLLQKAVPRKAESIEMASYIKLWGAVDRYFYLSKEVLEQLLKEDSVPIPDFLNKLENGYPINFQKYYKSKEMTIAYPSEIGFPIIYRVQEPTIVSVRGSVKVQGLKELLQGQLTQNITAEVKDFETRTETKIVAQLGHVCPFTLKYFGAGVETSYQYNIPLDGSVTLNLSSRNASVQAQLPERLQKVARLGRLQTVPYTFSYSLVDMKPFTEEQSTRVVNPRDKQPVQKQVQLLQKALGLDVKAIMKSDYTFYDFAAIYKHVTKFSPLTLISYWQKASSLKYNSFDVQFDPKNSETQQLSAQMAWDIKSSGEPKPSSQQQKSQSDKAPESMKEVRAESQQKLSQLIKSIEDQGISMCAQVNLTGRSTRKLSAYSAVAVGNNRRSPSVSSKVYIQTPQKKQYQVCAEGQVELPQIPEERQQILASSLRTPFQGKVMFGEQCSQSQQIEVEGYMEKDERAHQYATETPEARKCQHDEQIRFTQSPACVKAQVQASMLSHMYMNVKYQGVSPMFVNMTKHAQDWAKYLLFPHMQNDAVSSQGQPGQVKVHAYLDPKSWSLDFHVNQPQESTHFNKIRIPLSSLYPLYYIPSVKETISTKVAQLVQGDDKDSCIVQVDKIKTFDNVTLTAQIPSKCYVVMASDCSFKTSLTVMTKNELQHKAVKIWADKETIEILPSVSGQQPRVKVNGNVRPLSPEKPIYVKSRSQNDVVIAKIWVRSLSTIVVSLVKHSAEVVTDTKYVQTKMNPLFYRNRICGICSDKNGEKTAELRSPDKCVLTDAQKMVNSYAPCKPVDIPECVKVPEIPSSQIDQL